MSRINKASAYSKFKYPTTSLHSSASFTSESSQSPPCMYLIQSIHFYQCLEIFLNRQVRLNQVGFTEMCEKRQHSSSLKLQVGPSISSKQVKYLLPYEESAHPYSQEPTSYPQANSSKQSTSFEGSPNSNSGDYSLLLSPTPLLNFQKVRRCYTQKEWDTQRLPSERRQCEIKSEQKFAKLGTVPPLSAPKKINNFIQRGTSIISPQRASSKTCQGIFFNNLPGSNKSTKAKIGTGVSIAPYKKTPFTKGTEDLRDILTELASKVGSKTIFFNLVNRLLTIRSSHLRDAIVLREQKEIQTDPIAIDKALVASVMGIEVRGQPIAQRNLIKSLLRELLATKKEVFNLCLQQSQLEIELLASKIKYERNEIETLTSKLYKKHFPHFDKKATLDSSFSYLTMPIRYSQEKLNVAEDKYGNFPLIATEKRFLSSEIEKAVCNLKDIQRSFVNPFRNQLEQQSVCSGGNMNIFPA